VASVGSLLSGFSRWSALSWHGTRRPVPGSPGAR
jgi:hypothetical protein